MEYICFSAFKGVQPNETVEAVDGELRKDGRFLCLVTSQNGHDHFAKNSDGKGIERHNLCRAICSSVGALSAEYQLACAAALEGIDHDDADAIEAALSQLHDKSSDALALARKAGFITNGCWNHAFREATIKKLSNLADAIGAL